MNLHRSWLSTLVLGGILLPFQPERISAFAAEPAWISGAGFRYSELRPPPEGRPHLTVVSSNETGINFRFDVPELRGAQNANRLLGSGIAAGDVDGDGLCDLFFASTGLKSALYRNLGNWKFENITDRAGVAFEGQDSTGAALADMDGDGDLDLLVNSIGGGCRLLWNDGRGQFKEAVDSGLIRKFGSISFAIADVDGNGTLDLYVVNYSTTKIEDRPNTKIDSKTVNGEIIVTALDGVPTTSPELTNRYIVDADRVLREFGEADIFYLNDGKGKFTQVSWTGGAFVDEQGKPLTLPPYEWGLSAMFRDMNGDGAPDLYVCNDLFTPDRIWMNDGRGRFRAMPPTDVRHISLFSMGVDFGDINRDGFDDFIVVDMLSRSMAEQKIQMVGVRAPYLPVGKIDDRPQYKKNTVFLNRGDGTYAEIGQMTGLEATGWSWAPVFLDIDLDGYEDVIVSTGYYRDSLNMDINERMSSLRGKRKLSDLEYRHLKKLYPVLQQQNKTYRNRGDLTFEDKTSDWGFDHFGLSEGIALADLDNDGDLDVLLSVQNGPVTIYRNESSAPRLAVQLKGRAPNTRGIGAKIRINGAALPQQQEMISAGRYVCSDQPLRVFATPQKTSDLEIEVTWRNGSKSVVKGAQANRLYEIDETGATPSTRAEPTPGKTIFHDASDALRHVHYQSEYDDFARQPSIHRKLSQAGPGVAWFDFDADGWDDLAISAGNGGSTAVYRNNRDGTFARADKGFLLSMDALGLVGLPGGKLLSALSHYESALTNSLIQEMSLPSGASKDIFNLRDAAGAIAAADVDGDGELDLFVAGRVLPGLYPLAASSYLLRGGSSGFSVDLQLKNVGLVNSAAFSDLNGDGFPELLLACEWAPIRIFRNDRGKLTEATDAFGLSHLTGLWSGVAPGDFDGDGRMDFVASNLGRNTKFEAYRAKPLRIYYAPNRPFCLTASYEPLEKKWMPHATFATIQKGFLGAGERYLNHKSYSVASVEEVMSLETPAPTIAEAAVLESMVFLNRGEKFEAHPLPIDAQLAPAFGISVADFNGDGAEDLFLAQNFFPVDTATARYDAGRGLLLFGKGNGTFDAVPGQRSGIKIYGEQRACAAADYDHDGRTDLVVTQNGAATVLLRNQLASPGTRIRLRGPKGNENAVGAALRLVTTAGNGPVREIHAGAGYLSQDSHLQVLHTSTEATAVWVRWPGGQTKTYPLAKDAKEIELTR